MDRRIPANHKLGERVEGFADFAGRYVAIRAILGICFRFAGSIFVSYAAYRLFIKPFFGW
jgi:hypothetical protein